MVTAVLEMVLGYLSGTEATRTFSDASSEARESLAEGRGSRGIHSM